jgi:hypothetical protein
MADLDELQTLKGEMRNLKAFLHGYIHVLDNIMTASGTFNQFRQLSRKYSDFLMGNDDINNDKRLQMVNALMAHQDDIDKEKAHSDNYNNYYEELDNDIEHIEQQNESQNEQITKILKEREEQKQHMEERRQARREKLTKPPGDSKASAKDVDYDKLIAELETFGGKHKSRQNQKSKKNRKSKSRKNH